jgi:hypothetical protein
MVIVAACFYATGGLDIGSETTTEMLLTLGSGGLVAAAITQEGARRGRLWGIGSLAAFFCLAAFTALSVTWSVEPSDSWIEASRTFSYAATFAGAIALVRLVPGRWRSVISGVLLATVVVAGYAVGSKVFPSGGPSFARLEAPFNYWNVVGLMAALGVPPALWVGSRRDGHGALVVLSPPAICLLLVTVMLAYSRGSLLALVIGLAFWFAVVPLRLRSAAVLAIGGAGAAIVTAWAFSQSALTTDNASLAARSPAGHEFGGLLVVVLVACALAGLVLRFAALRNPPSPETRRRVGKALLVCVALVPVAFVLALTASSRGLFGSISHDVNTLTNTNVSVTNSATRLTALGSQRALYWSDALKSFDADPIAGSGAGSFQTTFLRYDKGANTAVAQAHSYIFQTLTDLGLVGLALSLALAAAWRVAARRAAGPFGLGKGVAPSESAERIGLLTMIACVLTFTVHSAVDWTWFVPGVAIIALLCAGWVAGRGPHATVLALGRPRFAKLRGDLTVVALAGTVVLLALLVTWSEWQPLLSYGASNAADSALSNGLAARSTALADADYRAAASDAHSAISENPLDFQPLVWLAYAQARLHPHDLSIAYATMVRAVRLQPSNYQTWYDLAYFDWYELGAARAALQVLAPALFLYPQYTYAQQLDLGLQSAAAAASAASQHRHKSVKRAAPHSRSGR